MNSITGLIKPLIASCVTFIFLLFINPALADSYKARYQEYYLTDNYSDKPQVTYRGHVPKDLCDQVLNSRETPVSNSMSVATSYEGFLCEVINYEWTYVGYGNWGYGNVTRRFGIGVIYSCYCGADRCDRAYGDAVPPRTVTSRGFASDTMCLTNVMCTPPNTVNAYTGLCEITGQFYSPSPTKTPIDSCGTSYPIIYTTGNKVLKERDYRFD